MGEGNSLPVPLRFILCTRDRRPLLGAAEGCVLTTRVYIAQCDGAQAGEQQVRYQAAALEAAAAGIVITDGNGNILWVNPAFVALSGYTLQEVVGKNPRLLKSGRHDAEFYHGMWNTILSGRVWQGEIVNRRKDGTFYDEELTITPVCSPTGEITHFVAIGQDISARKRAEEELALFKHSIDVHYDGAYWADTLVRRLCF